MRWSQGELYLCPECKGIRFPKDDDVTSLKQRVTSTSRKSSNEPSSETSGNVTGGKEVELQDTDIENTTTPTIINPLLAYMWFAMQGGTASNIRDTVLGHFTTDAIVEAKNALWDNSPTEVIGERLRRKDSTVRSEKEAHAQDILSALTKLDKSDQMPTILLEATSLAFIPRFHPEEINNASLIHRITLLEEKFTNLQEIMDRTVCENIAIKDQLHRAKPTFAEMVQTSPVSQLKVTSSVPPAIVIQHATPQELDTEDHPIVSREADLVDNNVVEGPTNRLPSTRGRPTRGGNRRGRGLSCGGRGGHAGSQLEANRSPSIDRRSTRSDFSQNSDNSSAHRGTESSQLEREDDNANEYRLPWRTQKQERRQQKSRHKVVTGNGRTSVGSFKGAREQVISLFIYMVDQATLTKDFKVYLADFGIPIHDLACVSHPDSKHKSFRLSVPASHYKDLLDPELWPIGVKVRKYVTPSSQRSTNS